MPPFPKPSVTMKKILAALVFCLFSALTAAQEKVSAAPFFAATLSDLDDKPAALERFRGKPLVVNFWARWCPPCRAEIPELIRFSQTYKGQIEVVGLAVENDATQTRTFAREYGMSYPIFVAKEKSFTLARALGNPGGGLPYTLFIDRHGKIIQTKLGLISKADLDAVIEPLLRK